MERWFSKEKDIDNKGKYIILREIELSQDKGIKPPSVLKGIHIPTNVRSGENPDIHDHLDLIKLFATKWENISWYAWKVKSL